MTSYTLIEDEMFTVIGALRDSHDESCMSGDHTGCEPVRLAMKMEAEMGEYR